MSDSWFRPKTYGWGVTPRNWKGWAAVGVFAVLQALIAVAFLLPGKDGAVDPLRLAQWFAGFFVAILVFVWVCRKKTDTDWRWHGESRR